MTDKSILRSFIMHLGEEEAEGDLLLLNSLFKLQNFDMEYVCSLPIQDLYSWPDEDTVR